jgi:hypothetical protein
MHVIALFFLGPKVVFLPKLCCTKLGDFDYGQGVRDVYIKVAIIKSRFNRLHIIS